MTLEVAAQTYVMMGGSFSLFIPVSDNDKKLMRQLARLVGRDVRNTADANALMSSGLINFYVELRNAYEASRSG